MVTVLNVCDAPSQLVLRELTELVGY
jgi:hypothetical protein